jgi:hypothetical protein
VRAHLSGATLDRYLDHYLTAWAQPPDMPVVESTASTVTAGQTPAIGPRKLAVDIDFPTADSIPPISIMNPEPKGPVAPGAAAAAAAAPDPAGHAQAPAPPSRHARKPIANPPAAAVAAAPPSPPTPVDPVWGPGTPAPAAAAASAPPSGTAPVQLNPYPAQPVANAAAAARTP